MMAKKITAYLGIFESKLEKLRDDIRKAEKAGKPVSKGMRDEAASLAEMLDDMKEHDVVQIECPHCEKKFKVDAKKVKLKTS